MTAQEIMEKLFRYATDKPYEKTCDTVKAGDVAREVTRLGVTMFATPDVIRQAMQWGAQMLIVHEPLYYNHWDAHTDDPVEMQKRKMIEDSGLVIVRFHDHPHDCTEDMIVKGLLRAVDLKAETTYVGFDHAQLDLQTPTTPKDLAKRMEETMGIAHIQICGAADAPCEKVSVLVGAIGDAIIKELKNPDSQVVVTGETSEWAYGEYARDAAQLGYKKALLILGHVGSEREGMRYTAGVCENLFPTAQVQYFDCAEVYTYTDTEA